ncbi:MAG: hypothetical protein Q9181_001441 [Wetmoreana brouardii]
MRKAVFEASNSLAVIDNLQSLKVKFPCACDTEDSIGFNRLCELMAFTLGPLKGVQFRVSVTFIAARAIDEYEEKESIYQGSSAEWKYENRWLWTHDTQCQEPDCLRLASSHEYLKDRMVSPTTAHPQPTTQQRRLLEVKKRAAPLGWNRGLQPYLDRLWLKADLFRDERDAQFIEEHHEEMDFDTCYDKALERIKELEDRELETR